mmetsp:Transcript_45098/g.109118  ORF Transcript_45098/g.109118 Transcript_45098/m.109118 type:complete len:214 (-) Transcript_45098:924-1565(-)
MKGSHTLFRQGSDETFQIFLVVDSIKEIRVDHNDIKLGSRSNCIDKLNSGVVETVLGQSKVGAIIPAWQILTSKFHQSTVDTNHCYRSDSVMLQDFSKGSTSRRSIDQNLLWIGMRHHGGMNKGFKGFRVAETARLEDSIVVEQSVGRKEFWVLGFIRSVIGNRFHVRCRVLVWPLNVIVDISMLVGCKFGRSNILLVIHAVNSNGISKGISW